MPVNAMGMTKALMEKVAEAGSRSSSSTTVCSTRYGNVLYSRGSVVPLFVDQIKQGLPLTITNPAMTRFLMPLHHCVDLVEFAFFNAQQGDVFVRKAASATIGDLAEATNRLFGSPVATKVIGVRHGEKLFETLASADELQRSTDMGDYYRVAMDSRGMNYAEYFEKGDPDHDFEGDYDSHTTELLTVEQIMALLESLPEVKAELEEWRRHRC
jgi:UDP-glucose 4-epimerase